MATREELIASAPEYIWADQVMGIWLDRDQPDRRSPLVKYHRAEAALPPGEDDPERCVICDERLEDGDKVYWSSNDDGHMHAECATSYVDEDGMETQAPPTPFTFKASEPASPIESQAAQIASLSAKVAEVERGRDREGLRAEEQWAGWVKADVAKRNAEARAERLDKALREIASRNKNRDQLQEMARAALQQEGESDE